jgi:O-antigen ligase
MWFNKWYYHYSDFTEPIGVDPLYLGLFVSWAILLLFFCSENIGSLFSRRLALVLLLFCCLFLVMIAARSLIAIVALIIIAFYVNNAFQRSNLVGLAKMGIFITIIGALSFSLPVTRERFEMLYEGSYSFSTFSIDRFIIWSTAMGEILREPQGYLFGKGTGSSEATMGRAYDRARINWEFEKKVNTHNQYLNFLMEFGFVGLMIILIWFVIVMKQSLQQSNYLGFALMAFFAASMFFENYLNRQKGVVFFSLFFCLYIAQPARGRARNLD